MRNKGNNLSYKYKKVIKSQNNEFQDQQSKTKNYKTKNLLNISNDLKFKWIIILILLFNNINSLNYDYNYYKLDNGLKWTILKRNNNLNKKVFISFSVNNGSTNDGIYDGASHILEHLIFGSINHYDSHHLFKKISFYKGHCNAITKLNTTTFYSNFNEIGLSEILEIYLKLILNGDLKYENFLKEIKNVNSELKMLYSKNDNFNINELIKIIYSNESNIHKDSKAMYDYSLKHNEFFENFFKHIKYLYNKYYKVNNISITLIVNKDKDIYQIINNIKDSIKIVQDVKILNDKKYLEENDKNNTPNNINLEKNIKNYYIENKNESIIKNEEDLVMNRNNLLIYKSKRNENQLLILFKVKSDILAKKNYIYFLFLILKNNKKLFKNSDYKNNVHLNYWFIDLNVIIFSFNFYIHQNDINNYELIIKDFYSYINFLIKQDLNEIYQSYYSKINYNYKNFISNKKYFWDYFMGNEENISINLSEFNIFIKDKTDINEKLKFIKAYNQTWDEKFNDNMFKDLLNNLEEKNAYIIYNIKDNLKINKEKHESLLARKNEDNEKNYSLKITYNKEIIFKTYYLYIDTQNYDNLILDKEINNPIFNYDYNKHNKEVNNIKLSYNYDELTTSNSKYKLFFKEFILEKNFILIDFKVNSQYLIENDFNEIKNIYYSIFEIYMIKLYEENNIDIKEGYNFTFFKADTYFKLQFKIYYSAENNNNINLIIEKLFSNTIITNYSLNSYKNILILRKKLNNLDYCINKFDIIENKTIFNIHDYNIDIKNIINNIDNRKFFAFISSLYSNSFIEIYITGDISKDHAINYFKKIFDEQIYNSYYDGKINKSTLMNSEKKFFKLDLYKYFTEDLDKNSLYNIVNSFNLLDFKMYNNRKYLLEIKNNFDKLNFDKFDEDVKTSLLNIKQNFDEMDLKELKYDEIITKIFNYKKLYFENIFKKKFEIAKLNNSEDDNNIYIKKYYFIMKNYKDYVISYLIVSNIKDILFNYLRNEKNVGYIVSFFFIPTVDYSKFFLLIMGNNFNKTDIENYIIKCYINSIDFFNNLDDEILKKMIKITIDSFLDIVTLKSFGSINYKYQIYKEFLKFNDFETPEISKEDIKKFIEDNILNNINNILIEQYN